MPHHDEHPNFFRFFYEEALPLREALTQGQCQNLIGAMAMYFLFKDEPHGLPNQARALFESHRARLDKYRNSVMNGKKNSPKTRQKDSREIEVETDPRNQAPTGRIPAETQESGTYPEADPETLLGRGVGYPQKKTVNSKKKSPPPPEDDFSEFIDP